MRILFVQFSLNPPGGGNAVAAWMAQALARENELTVLTATPVRLAEINEQFGTGLSETDAQWLCRPPVVPPILRRLPIRGALVKVHLFCRHARSLRPGFDLAVTANNETDLGPPAIQYVHYPKLDSHRPDAAANVLQSAPLVAVYQRIVAGLTGFSYARARANRTLANSLWTARRLARSQGIQAEVLPPPVAMAAGTATFEEREDCFVAVGRMAPEKRLETIIAIVEALRARGWQSRLRILGASDDSEYAARIAAMIAGRPWVEVRTDVSRDELTRALHSSRWGLHAMIDEHYGMAVAEMVRAGCIVFAHDSGGQVEILRDPRLCWRDIDDAVARIEAVAHDRTMRAQIIAALSERGRSLGVDAFMERIRALAAEVAGERR